MKEQDKPQINQASQFSPKAFYDTFMKHIKLLSKDYLEILYDYISPSIEKKAILMKELISQRKGEEKAQQPKTIEYICQLIDMERSDAERHRYVFWCETSKLILLVIVFVYFCQKDPTNNKGIMCAVILVGIFCLGITYHVVMNFVAFEKARLKLAELQAQKKTYHYKKLEALSLQDNQKCQNNPNPPKPGQTGQIKKEPVDQGKKDQRIKDQKKKEAQASQYEGGNEMLNDLINDKSKQNQLKQQQISFSKRNPRIFPQKTKNIEYK